MSLTPADRTIAALRATHDTLAALVPDLTEEQLRGPSGASEWSLAQVLSHLGSGAEIALRALAATRDGNPVPGQDANQQVWDRWNAMGPREQAAGFLEHDTRLVEAYEALTADEREGLRFDLGFLPAPLPVAGMAGMRLNEAALHSWDVRVELDPGATVPEDVARLLVEQLAGDLGFMIRFIGKADALAKPATVRFGDDGLGLVIDDAVSFTGAVTDPNATFVGPMDAALRLIAGRLTPAHTAAGVEVVGAVTLDDLRAVFPGY